MLWDVHQYLQITYLVWHYHLNSVHTVLQYFIKYHKENIPDFI